MGDPKLKSIVPDFCGAVYTERYVLRPCTDGLLWLENSAGEGMYISADALDALDGFFHSWFTENF